MKNVMKTMIVLGVILFLLGAIPGCKDKSKEYQGIYFGIDDRSEYIELEDNGVMVIRQRINRIGEWPPEYKEATRKWKVDGGEIVFIYPSSGDEARYKITRNTIRIGRKVFVRHGAASEGDQKGDNIPGNYILEETVGQETKRQAGIVIFRKDGTIRGAELGKWTFENGFVQLYAVEGPQVGNNGRLEGDDIVFEIITKDGETAIARFIKQDGMSKTDSKPKEPARTIYEQWEDDDKRLLAEPQFKEPQITSERKGSGGIDDIPDDKMTWVKCNNPACKAEYQMGRKAYYKAVEERLDPMR